MPLREIRGVSRASRPPAASVRRCDRDVRICTGRQTECLAATPFDLELATGAGRFSDRRASSARRRWVRPRRERLGLDRRGFRGTKVGSHQPFDGTGSLGTSRTGTGCSTGCGTGSSTGSMTMAGSSLPVLIAISPVSWLSTIVARLRGYESPGVHARILPGKNRSFLPGASTRLTEKKRTGFESEAGSGINLEPGFDQPQVPAHALGAQGQGTFVGAGHFLPAEGKKSAAPHLRCSAR